MSFLTINENDSRIHKMRNTFHIAPKINSPWKNKK
jgi:hypothetical protein